MGIDQSTVGDIRAAVHPIDGPVLDDRILASPARVRAVMDVGLLDTGDEDPFDRWAQRATELTGASAALVSLVDETRSFFKSYRLRDGSAGEGREVPISMSLCREVVTRDAPLIVNDAVNDPRTKGYGAVRAFPVGAYAGMPLRSAEGHVLGSFCVVDPVARDWSKDEIIALADLATAVQSELRLRAAQHENRRQRALTEIRGRIYALMIEGAPRATVLAELTTGVEQQTDGLRARVVLPDAEPSGVLLNEACSDVAIVGMDGVTYGRFALCSDHPWTALPQELALLEQAAGLAAIVLERNAVTRELTELERQTQNILDHAPDAFVSMDDEGRIIEWNLQAEATFGWTRHDALGRTMAELIIPPPTRGDHERGLARYLETGEAHVLNRPIEVQALCQDGRLLPVELTIAAVRRGDNTTFNAFVRDISERHAGELAVREAEAMFRGAFTHASVAMCLATLDDGRWLQVNPALCALLGYREDQLLGRAFADFTHRDDVDANLEGARQLRDGEITALETEKRYLHAEGHVIWVSLSVSLLRDAQQEPRCFIAQVVDITARKAAEEALVASERHLAEAQALGGLGSWDWDLDTGVVTWSEQLCQIAGFAREEYPRTVDGFTDLVRDHDRAKFQEILDQTLGTGFSDSNYRLVRPDGDVRWVHGRSRALYDADGQALRVSGTLQDITGRVAAEHALRDAEERFRRSFDEAPIGMALVSLDGRWTKVNDALCEIVGYPESQLMALRFQDLTHPHDLSADEEFVRQMIAGERTTYQMDKRYLHADGRIVWVQLNVSLARDADDQAMYFISQIQDITARKRFEERLKQMALRDHLTGLYNRRGFEEEFARALAGARRYRRAGAVLMIDLDGFKAVNDTLGHKAGDELLTGIARLLEHRLRETDILGRLGGDEFAVLLPEVSAEQAAAVVAALNDAIRSHTQLLIGQHINVTASIGFVMFDGSQSAGEILAAADSEMYTA
ncbi:MAG: PAS domain S-box protein, partial [Myxococcota bacterium]|nr:PAS domain S-box protein [Myxococcota bacterium]